MAGTYLVFSVNCITLVDLRSVVMITPVSALTSVGTITSHMAGVTAHSAYYVGSKVALFWTVVFTVTDLSTYEHVRRRKERENGRHTVLASLIFVITKGTVQGSQLSELVSLQLVLTFGD